MRPSASFALLSLGLIAAPSLAQQQVPATTGVDGGNEDLRRTLAAERQELERQQRALDEQRARIDRLEARLSGRGDAATQSAQTALPPGGVPLPASPPPVPPPATAVASTAGGEVQTVGEAPSDQRQVQVAVLAEQGGIITKARRATMEVNFEYARADRNQVVFRGVQIPEAVLIGVFDINESRQDVLTVGAGRATGADQPPRDQRAAALRLSLGQVGAGAVANPGQPMRATRSAGQWREHRRYRLRATLSDHRWAQRRAISDRGRAGGGADGHRSVQRARDPLGNALKGATGAGFWGVTPNLTAILPTDPALLFATLGYTYNFARTINRQIGAAYIERVAPGSQPSASAGIAIALNPRTSISFGYAHTWAMGTRTRVRALNQTTQELGDAMTAVSRDLQIGRLLLGVSYRTSPSTTINWNVEVGATDDAADVRTTLRIPFTFTAY